MQIPEVRRVKGTQGGRYMSDQTGRSRCAQALYCPWNPPGHAAGQCMGRPNAMETLDKVVVMVRWHGLKWSRLWVRWSCGLTEPPGTLLLRELLNYGARQRQSSHPTLGRSSGRSMGWRGLQ